MQNPLFWLGASFIALIALVFLMVFARYFGLWIQSKFTGAGISLANLVMMSFRKVNPGVIVRSKIMAVQSGLTDSNQGLTTRALEAHYLALGLANLIMTLSPERIVLGGGVMHQEALYPLIREEVKALLNGYIQAPQILERPDEYIVAPGLGDRAGVLGAIALAQQAERDAAGM